MKNSSTSLQNGHLFGIFRKSTINCAYFIAYSFEFFIYQAITVLQFKFNVFYRTHLLTHLDSE